MADTLKTMPVGSLSDIGLDSDDKIILYRDSDKGAYVITVGEMLEGITKDLTETDDMFWQMANFMGSHNALYRGKNLGSAVTDEQWAEIKAGTFNDLFIGDYWEINGVKWLIASFDYFLNTGSNYKVDDHHIVIVPEEALYTAQMNTSDTTTGGYVGSRMYTNNLADAKTAANNAFGSAHILTHEQYFTNAINADRTYPNAASWYDCTLEIMNEEMVYGTTIMQQQVNATYRPTCNTVSKSQLALFTLRPDLISIRAAWWLRDIWSDANFCIVTSYGYANSYAAGTSYGVRPAFCIYAS